MTSMINQFFDQCQEYVRVTPDFLGLLWFIVFVFVTFLLTYLFCHKLEVPYSLIIAGCLSLIITGYGYLHIQHYYDNKAQTVKVKAIKTIDEIDQKYPYATVLDQQDESHTTVAFTKKPISVNQINQSKNHEVNADNKNCLLMTFDASTGYDTHATYPYTYRFKAQPKIETKSTKTYLKSLLNKCNQ